MKTPIIKSLLLATIVSIAQVSCNNSPKEKEADLNAAKGDVVEAKADLVESRLDSIKDFSKYKESIEKKLVENDRVIAELKSKNNSKDKSTQQLYVKQLDKLELKNSELKSKIENYRQGPEQKWELFKVDFNKDIDDLGKSISNMAERNMKK
jgi:vacuolar-type H+-ATPase subunit I/STV1